LLKAELVIFIEELFDKLLLLLLNLISKTTTTAKIKKAIIINIVLCINNFYS
jgi:hypothetical protein